MKQNLTSIWKTLLYSYHKLYTKSTLRKTQNPWQNNQHFVTKETALYILLTQLAPYSKKGSVSPFFEF